MDKADVWFPLENRCPSKYEVIRRWLNPVCGSQNDARKFLDTLQPSPTRIAQIRNLQILQVLVNRENVQEQASSLPEYVFLGLDSEPRISASYLDVS